MRGFRAIQSGRLTVPGLAECLVRGHQCRSSVKGVTPSSWEGQRRPPEGGGILSGLSEADPGVRASPAGGTAASLPWLGCGGHGEERRAARQL